MTPVDQPLADSSSAPIADEEPSFAFPPDPREAPATPERSLIDDLRELAGDAQTLLEAEKAFQLARIGYAANRGKGVAVSFVVAAVLLYFALIALVVGLLLALGPILTPWGALAAVAVPLGLVALLFLLTGMGRLRRMRIVLSGGEDESS